MDLRRTKNVFDPGTSIKFDRIPFDPRNSTKRFDLCPSDNKNSTSLQPPKLEVPWRWKFKWRLQNPFKKSQRKLLKRKKRWDSKLDTLNCDFFPGWHHWKTTIENCSIFPKTLPGIETPKKDELIILGSPLGPKSQADLLEKKIIAPEIFNGNVEKLDAH